MTGLSCKRVPRMSGCANLQAIRNGCKPLRQASADYQVADYPGKTEHYKMCMDIIANAPGRERPSIKRFLETGSRGELHVTGEADFRASTAYTQRHTGWPAEYRKHLLPQLYSTGKLSLRMLLTEVSVLDQTVA